MIPYSYNMVDMGGIDLAEANGTVVDGLYNRLALARNACGDLILYNWKFVGIEIAPSACSTLDEGTSIIINGMIEVTDEDSVTIITLETDLTPLSVTENGQYSPADYEADGFSEVSVDVSPALEELTVTQNGVEIFPSEGYQGFSKVIVAIPETPPVITVTATGGYNGGAVVTVENNGIQLFRGVGDTPYNLVYTPNSGSATVNGSLLSISVPTLSTSSSPLVINLSWRGTDKTVTFMHQGANTSYGYGSQSTEVNFGQ